MRLFLAINLPAPARDAIRDATEPLRAAAAGLSWTRTHNLHLTIKFLGQVPEGKVQPLVGSVSGIANRHRPFALSFSGLGAFPNLRAPRIVWMGVAPEPKLELLHHDLEVVCAGLGYPVEGRAFRPHLTLGRAKGGLDREAARHLAAVVRPLRYEATVEIRTVDLMRSDPAIGGSRYTVLHSASLGGR
ncbi:MAG: RNA 2',3'-cyclic phosphodiesterase [Gemmatimonadota bacterium]|nr:RNA 2',3'-cyclic phosphodiesterase [Gemmatimonadota bacterium]